MSLSFREGYIGWKTDSAEVYSFVGILIARGLLAKGLPLKELWSRKWGLLFIQKNMYRNRFLEILKLIRFDDKSTRRRRLVGNKFALISDVWYRFIHNCQLAYVPNAYLTVEKKLFPTKVRCQLIQFMPNPINLGLNFDCLLMLNQNMW